MATSSSTPAAQETDASDLLFEKLAPALRKEGLRLADAKTMKLVRKRRQFCLDFYHGRVLEEDGGRNEYLKSFFQVWIAEDNAMQDPEKLVLEHAPITEQLIDMKSRLYSEQPKRSIVKKSEGGEEGGAAEEANKYTELLRNSKWFPISKRVEQYTQLLSQIALGIFLDTREDKAHPVVIFKPYLDYWPIYDDEDPTGVEPYAILYPSALRTDDGEQIWIRYDPDEIIYYTPGGVVVPHKDLDGNLVDREPNPYGTLNFVFPCRKMPIEDYFSLPRVPLVLANQAIDVAMVSLNESVIRNGFKAVKIIGKGAQLKEFLLNKSHAVTVEPGMEGGQQSSIDVLDLQGDFAQLIDTIRFKTEMAGQALNVTVQWKIEGGAASGVAYEIMGVRDLDDRRTQTEVYTETIERPIYEKLLAFKRDGQYSQLDIEDGDLIVDFPEPVIRPSATEKQAQEKHDISMFKKNYIDLIKEDNPDLNDQTAADKLDKNIRINRPLMAGGIMTEQDVLAILNGKNNGQQPGSATPPATPPAPAGDAGQGEGTLADLNP